MIKVYIVHSPIKIQHFWQDCKLKIYSYLRLKKDNRYSHFEREFGPNRLSNLGPNRARKKQARLTTLAGTVIYKNLRSFCEKCIVTGKGVGRKIFRGGNEKAKSEK